MLQPKLITPARQAAFRARHAPMSAFRRKLKIVRIVRARKHASLPKFVAPPGRDS
jgi:hypothetical protein